MLFRHVSSSAPDLGSRRPGARSAENGMPRQKPRHEGAWALVAFAWDQHRHLRSEVEE